MGMALMEGRSSYEESPVRSSSTEYDKPDDVLTPRHGPRMSLRVFEKKTPANRIRAVLQKLLHQPILGPAVLVCCRKIAHRVGRISPLNVENARQEDGPPTPNKSRLQRFREWQFKPLGLEPSPELIALSVGKTSIHIDWLQQRVHARLAHIFGVQAGVCSLTLMSRWNVRPCNA